MNEKDNWDIQHERYKRQSGPWYGSVEPATIMGMEHFISMMRRKEEPLHPEWAFAAWVYSEEMAFIRSITQGE